MPGNLPKIFFSMRLQLACLQFQASGFLFFINSDNSFLRIRCAMCLLWFRCVQACSFFSKSAFFFDLLGSFSFSRLPFLGSPSPLAALSSSCFHRRAILRSYFLF